MIGFTFFTIRIFHSLIFFDGFGSMGSAVGRALAPTKGQKDFFGSFFWHPVASCAHSDSVHPPGLPSSPLGGRINQEKHLITEKMPTKEIEFCEVLIFKKQQLWYPNNGRQTFYCD